MNEISITNTNGQLTVSSLQVATNFEKRHSDVIEAIETLIKGCAEKSADLFIETKYQQMQNKQWYKCYNITRDGFSLLVMGFTGKKALEWKLKYIEAFNTMEKHIKENKPLTVDKSKTLEIKEMNARVRMSNQLLKLAKIDTLSPEYKNVLVAKSAEVLTGQMLIPLPESEQKTYSATEIGQLFGVSAQIIGRLATKHNLKTDEYGKWYHDKSRYSNKEVDTFRYNDNGVEKFKELLG